LPFLDPISRLSLLPAFLFPAAKMPRVPPPERLPDRMPLTRVPIRLADSLASEQRPVVRVVLPRVPAAVNRCLPPVDRMTASPAVRAIVIMAPE
jgi:hypothetical protein